MVTLASLSGSFLLMMISSYSLSFLSLLISFLGLASGFFSDCCAVAANPKWRIAAAALKRYFFISGILKFLIYVVLRSSNIRQIRELRNISEMLNSLREEE